MNGDVRVAFDLVKTCFNKLYYHIKHEMVEFVETKVRITQELVQKVVEEKYGSKVKETL